MRYTKLPFNQEPEKYTFNREKLASPGKRFAAFAIDIGIPILITAWVAEDNSDINAAWIGVFVILVNSIGVQGATGFSLGKYVTNSTLVIPKGRSFEKVGPAKMVLRYAPIMLVAYLFINAKPGTRCDANYYTDTWENCTERNSSIWWIILFVGIATLVAFERSPTRQIAWDHLVGTMVLDRRRKFDETSPPRKNVRQRR